VAADGANRSLSSYCSTRALAVCDPTQPATCVDLALDQPVLAPTLLTIACLHGRQSACGEWPKMAVGEQLLFRNFWPIGCARGSADACASNAFVALVEHDADRSAALGERSCELGSPRGCAIAALAHLGAGRKQQAVPYLDRACAGDSRFEFCADADKPQKVAAR
jgi:hypothetical protein